MVYTIDTEETEQALCIARLSTAVEKYDSLKNETKCGSLDI